MHCVTECPAPSAPPDLRARIAASRAQLVELLPIVRSAAAVHQEAVAFLYASVPAGMDFWDLVEVGEVFRVESGCAALRSEVRYLHDVLAVIDDGQSPD